MSMIQIRNVPENVHGALKARAAIAGMSLSDFLLREMTRVVEKPTLEELRERLASRGGPVGVMMVADAVRSERDEN